MTQRRLQTTDWLILAFAAFLFIVPIVGTAILPDTDTAPPTTVSLEAARAIQPPTYADGSLNPDYKDQAIAVLQYALTRALEDCAREQAFDRIAWHAYEDGVPAHIAFALVEVESGFDPTAVSHAGAIGLAQVKLSTARIYRPTTTRAELHDADINLHIGFQYLRDLRKRFGTWEAALAAYNMGPTRLARSGRRASTYSDRVMRVAGE